MEKLKTGGIEWLRSSVLEMIRDDGLTLGDKLPSEKEMSERFHVSRPTLREALKLLEQDSIIEAQQGKGHIRRLGVSDGGCHPISRGRIPDARVFPIARVQGVQFSLGLAITPPNGEGDDVVHPKAGLGAVAVMVRPSPVVGGEDQSAAFLCSLPFGKGAQNATQFQVYS